MDVHNMSELESKYIEVRKDLDSKMKKKSSVNQVNLTKIPSAPPKGMLGKIKQNVGEIGNKLFGYIVDVVIIYTIYKLLKVKTIERSYSNIKYIKNLYWTSIETKSGELAKVRTNVAFVIDLLLTIVIYTLIKLSIGI